MPNAFATEIEALGTLRCALASWTECYIIYLITTDRQHCNRIFGIFLHHCCFCLRVHYCFGLWQLSTSPTFRYQVLVVSTTFIGPGLVDAFCRCRRAWLAGPTICTLAHAGPWCSKQMEQDASQWGSTRTSTSWGSDLDLYTI